MKKCCGRQLRVTAIYPATLKHPILYRNESTIRRITLIQSSVLSQRPATLIALEIFISFTEIEYGSFKYPGSRYKWVMLHWSQCNVIHCFNSIYGSIQQK